MSLRELGAGDVIRLMRCYGAALRAHRSVIDRLNVFPVPDGDTGTNMTRTVESVEAELATLELGGEPQLSEVLSAISHGSLMGARGNSGVILCQLLRGLSDSLEGCAAIGPAALAAALVAADVAARAAVLRPVEGTVLTVSSRAAAAAACSAESGEDLETVTAAAREAAHQALLETPELLAVLAEAGVVDAGGAGLLLFFESLFLVVREVDSLPALRLPESVEALVEVSVEAGNATVFQRGEIAADSPRYEVMYFLDAPDESIEGFRLRFGEIGDSVVVVGGAGLYNCHVHTDDIGAAIEAGLDAGRPRQVRVADLREATPDEEHHELLDVASIEEPRPGWPRLAPVTSVVAVATGGGIRRILASLGVASVIEGGQSMNPSTAEILEVTESVVGRDIVLLPNNANIVPVAEQVAKLSRRRVFVIPTKGVQEALAALVAYDPAASGEDNVVTMAAAADAVVAGEVTRAVRRATTPAGEVAKGEWMGLSRQRVEVLGASLSEAALRLVERLVAPGQEILTLIAGDALEAGEFDDLVAELSRAYPELSVERLDGGQALYPLLLSLE